MPDNGPADRAMVLRDNAAIIEAAVVNGDLEQMTKAQRTAWYAKTCESLGLNPFTQPFQYIKLNNKLTLYARRDCTDQLRRIHNVSLSIVARELVGEVYVVTARATMFRGTPQERTDESVGAVWIGGLKGADLANCYMKSETKAKRRVTLSIVGLGWLDETEVETIPGAQIVNPDQPALPLASQVDAEPRQTLTREELVSRWDRRWQEAFSLGVPEIDPDESVSRDVEYIEPINPDTPNKVIVARLKLLVAAIERRKLDEGAAQAISEATSSDTPF